MLSTIPGVLALTTAESENVPSEKVLAFLTCEAGDICFQALVIGTEPGKRVCADRVDGEGCFSICRGGWG